MNGASFTDNGDMLSILLFSLSFCFNVTIDAGHGGIDTGASYFGANESEITLKVSRLLERKLNAKHGINVHLTRAHDKALDLTDRVNLAHKQRADLFISIHTNSSPAKKAKGLEVYLENVLPPDQESLFLAYRENQYQTGTKEIGRPIGRPSLFENHNSAELKTILDDIAKSHFLLTSVDFAQVLEKEWKQQRGGRTRIRQAPFYVVSSINAPSVLVEIGFLSNPQEAKALQDPKHQEEIAEILYRTILKYKESVDKQRI